MLDRFGKRRGEEHNAKVQSGFSLPRSGFRKGSSCGGRAETSPRVGWKPRRSCCWHKTEPNSGLGKAISYLLNHWTKLTLFLRQAGAPIDNYIVERALKKAILNRKNALFYKTLNGAGVGDLFMSLIHTCELNDANPFDYLTELLRHAAELKQHPSEWMPWNYRDTLARLATPEAA